MVQYTVTAFRWTGTYYNALYNTSYSATIDDDDAFLNGASDTNETVSINGGAFGATAGPPYNINVSFTDTNGDPHVETFYFFNTGRNWYFIPGPGSEFTVGATLGSYQSHTTTPTPYSTITCFVGGTLIETEHGPIPVERLRAGIKILTIDGVFKTLRIPMNRKLGVQEVRANPKLRPVRIMVGSLGIGLPKRDLLVSRQHRMLVQSKIAERIFGKSEVLVPAIKLTELPGIFVDEAVEEVEYFHLLFDQHEVIYAEGAPTESLYTGPEALKAVDPEAREEILTIFPEVADLDYAPEPARFIPSGKLQKKLIERHLKNERPLLA
jgi:hypothetical protein